MNKQEIEKAISIIRASSIEGDALFTESIDVILNYAEHQLTNGWIPVSEKLPNKAGYYLITAEGFSLQPFIEYAYYDEGKTCKWLYIADGNEEENQRWEEELVVPVIAWQPLPPKYEEVSE